MQNHPTNNPIQNRDVQPSSSSTPQTVAFPTPDNPPWGSWVALGVWGGSVLLILILPLLFFAPYLFSQHINLADKEALSQFIKTDQTGMLIQILSIFPAHILTLILAWFVVTQFRKYSFRKTLGWELNGFKIWHAVAITVGFFLVGALMMWLFGKKENDFETMLKSYRNIVFPVAILATFTAPLVEEVVYRGVLYSAFQRTFGIVYGVVLTTFLFALVHVPQYSRYAEPQDGGSFALTNFDPDYATITTLFLLSLTLTMIRVYTKNLLPCIILHTIFNGIQSVILIIEPYFSHLSNKPPQ